MPTRTTPYLAALISGLLYLAFLSHNPVVDAVYYAWCGRYGHELAHPHHLLYNYWLRGIMLLSQLIRPGGAGENTLFLFQAGNALAGAACIGILCNILQKHGLPSRSAFWLSLAVAGCWGFARFATDNEAYVLPILFSLIALRLAAFLNRWAWLAGLFSAIAILFHQVQVWWALPMLWLVWRQGGLRPAVVFAAWHLLVPIGYWAVWGLDVDLSLKDFLMGEFKAGGVHTGWGLMTAAKTGVQVVRSFIQLHDTMLIGNTNIWILHSIFYLSIILLLLRYYYSWVKPKLAAPIQEYSLTNSDNELSMLGWILALLLVTFSFFSQANAEFLAGLPFASVLWLSHRSILRKTALRLAISLWTWNALFAHRIQVLYQIEPDKKIAHIIYTQNVDAILLTHKLEVDWWYAYLYGERPTNTRHLAWTNWIEWDNHPEIKYPDDFDSLSRTPLTYSGRPVGWRKILYEKCRPLTGIVTPMGDKDHYCHIPLPGFKDDGVVLYENWLKNPWTIQQSSLVKATRNIP